MKRRLINFYRHQVPEAIKQAIPDSFLAYATGKLYQRYPHPDLGFYHARHLSRIGQGDKAAQIYDQTKTGTVFDPLFDCHTIAVQPLQYPTESAGPFYLEFCYSGIKIVGNIPENQAPTPQQVDIYLDDQLLRSERLTYHKGIASFHFSIKRSTIKLFNPKSVISLRTPDGKQLVSRAFGTGVMLEVPHGNASITARLEATGTLDKKGNIRPDKTEVHTKQQAYLSLYQRANCFFKQEFGRPLIIVCGTLLGQHRTGNFIVGDDDFDVGYVSEKTDPEAVKLESVMIMEKMVTYGFSILLNRQGKPFRISDTLSGLEIHLDVTPIFTCKDDHVWMHKLSYLEMGIDLMRQTITEELAGIEVDKPIGAETYLAANYGPNWHTPDPNFSYADWTVSAEIVDGLRATCLTPSEQRDLNQRLNAAQSTEKQGRFIPLSLRPLYPIENAAECLVS